MWWILIDIFAGIKSMLDINPWGLNCAVCTRFKIIWMWLNHVRIYQMCVKHIQMNSLQKKERKTVQCLPVNKASVINANSFVVELIYYSFEYVLYTFLAYLKCVRVHKLYWIQSKCIRNWREKKYVIKMLFVYCHGINAFQSIFNEFYRKDNDPEYCKYRFH